MRLVQVPAVLLCEIPEWLGIPETTGGYLVNEVVMLETFAIEEVHDD